MKSTNHSFETLLQDAGRSAALSAEERSRMRATLARHMVLHPLPHAAVTAHPFFAGLFSALRQPAFAALALLLMVSVGGGTAAYAAEGALPGDLLYAVKVKVIEPAQASLALSAEAKAAAHMTFAERRLTEAAELALLGALDTDTETMLAENFEANADVVVAATSSPRFLARLSAYRDVLERIDTRTENRATRALQGAIHTRLALADTHAIENAAGIALAPAPDAGRAFKGAESADAGAEASSSRLAPPDLELSSTFALEIAPDDEKASARALLESAAEAERRDVFTRVAARLGVDVFATTTAEKAAPTLTPKNRRGKGGKGSTTTPDTSVQAAPSATTSASHPGTASTTPSGALESILPIL